MPTYVYECSACKDVYEVEQRITENALDTCRCGSVGTIKRLIQPIAVMFKGDGFHINDYADKKSAPVSESAKADAPIPDAPAATPLPASVDTTPAAAPAAPAAPAASTPDK